MARTRYILGKETAHVWAHATHDRGRNRSHGPLYFEGDIIFSYGAHFPIAQRIERKGKTPLFLFTTRTYSVTTAKHLHEVRRAIPSSSPRIDAHPDLWRALTGKGKANRARVLKVFTEEMRQVAEEVESISARFLKRRAKARDNAAWSIESTLEKLDTWADLFPALRLSRRGVTIPKGYRDAEERAAAIARARTLQAEMEEVRRARRDGRDARRREQWAKADAHNAAIMAAVALPATIPAMIDDWRHGRKTIIDGEYFDGPRALPWQARQAVCIPSGDMLRIDPDDASWVESSQGVRVPARVARALYNALSTYAGERGWADESEIPGTLGGYGPIRILWARKEGEESILSVGCHRFTLAEIEFFGRAAGWHPPTGTPYAPTEEDAPSRSPAA